MRYRSSRHGWFRLPLDWRGWPRSRGLWPSLQGWLGLAGGDRADKTVLVTAGLIVAFGLVMLASASSVVAYTKFGSAYYLILHQLFLGLLPGLALFFLASRFDYRRLERYTLYFFFATLALLALVFIPGISATFGTSRSWVAVGSIAFQPSEIAKLTFILFFAGWFSQRGLEMTKDFWNGLVPFGVVLGVVAGMLVLQPDFGMLLIYLAIGFSMYFVAGARFSHLAALFALGIGGLGLLVLRFAHAVARLTVFLHPGTDPQGVGYQLRQALLAVGSGGWFGLGYGQSRQKFSYLPEVIGDSIFAVIAEELGFFVAAGLGCLFGLLLFRCLKLGRQSKDPYGQLIVIGVVAWFGTQIALNIGAMLGVLPLTGVPLPLVSYGGSALATALAALGIVVNISKTAR